MASAQVLPNSASSSRKQEHLQAGKRRLEEFRKKKAEGRAKKTASAGQLQSIDVTYEKSPQESEFKRLLDSDGVSTCEIDHLAGNRLPGVASFDHSKASDSAPATAPVSSNVTKATSPVSATSGHSFHADSVQKSAKDQESDWSDGSRHPGPSYVNHNYWKEDKNLYVGNYSGPQGLKTYEGADQSIDLNLVHGSGKGDRSSYQYGRYSLDEALIKADEIYPKESSVKDSDESHASVSSILSEKSYGDPVQSEISLASISPSNAENDLYTDAVRSNAKFKESVLEIGRYRHAVVDSNGPTIFDTEGRKHSNSTNHEYGINGVAWNSSQTLPTGFSFKSSSDHNPLYPASEIPEPGSRRIRPSFLDSLNVTRVSSVPQPSFNQSEKAETFLSKSSEVQNMDMVASSSSKQQFLESENVGSFDKIRASNLPSMYEHSLNSLVFVGNEGKVLSRSVKDHSMEKKQDDDFAPLEQHIEDLTQEKFSLQRALDASRTLAESLAAENSSLTDSYNQQGAIINELKSDMERLQEEIKAQLLELESFKMEYANAQLECNAADERAKILAAEVIGLEEKALKLRSSELKLERQLENTNAEITSFKKKVFSLEKERQDLQFTIDSLQEEKKVLQLKLRKASSSGKSMDATKNPSAVKDVSTSTEDLCVEASNLVRSENSDIDVQNASDHEMQDPTSISFSDRSTFLFPENRQLHLPAASLAIPPDQLRTIDNINSLVSELALEKEELLQSLASESSHRSKVQELNKELSRKLETQTQRLELLTAQSMATDNIPARSTDSQPVHDSTTYADEGDEVVERVLGWIMKLFPGGPSSKRRTSKLL